MTAKEKEEIESYIYDAVMSAQQKAVEGVSLSRLEKKLDQFITKVEKDYVEYKEFMLRVRPLEYLVYGFAGLALTAVIGALLISIGLSP